MAGGDAELALIITARSAAEKALTDALKLVTSLGPTSRRATEEHRKGIEQSRRSLAAFRSDMRGLTAQLGTLVSGFESGAASAGLLRLSLGGAGLAAIGIGMSFDSSQAQMRNAFTVLLGGSAQANSALAQLNAVAGDLPFTLTTINQAGQRLAAAGFTDFTKVVQTIADAVAATGDLSADKFQSITSGFASLKSTGVFQYGIISDLMGAGVPIISALQKLPQYAGMSTYAITQMLQRLSGRMPADAILPQIMDALQTLTGGLAHAQLDTLGGAIVRLQDRFAIFMGSISGGVTDTATSAVKGLGDMFDGLTQSMARWDPKIRGMLGWAVLISSAVAGVGGLGGSIPGMGALGQLFGGGGGMGGGMLAIVIVIIALIALLTPWEAIFNALQTLLESILEAIRGLPHGGGGGGGFPGGGAIPAVTTTLVLTPDMVDAQRKIDAWGALLGKVQLNPDRPGTQARIDGWADLTHKLALVPSTFDEKQIQLDGWPSFTHMLELVLPSRDDEQRQIDMWSNLTKDIDLPIPARNILQDEVNTWDPFTHPIDIPTPQRSVLQNEVDLWDPFFHPIVLDVPGRDVPQAQIDLWDPLMKALDLPIPNTAEMQGKIDSTYPELTSGLGLYLPRPEDLQGRINTWPDFYEGLGLILPYPNEMQNEVNRAYPNLDLGVGLTVNRLSIPPGIAPPGVDLPPGIYLRPGALPKFAEGGIVTSPTVAMLGEHGAEAVVPLGSAAGGGDTFNLHFHGPLLGQDIEDVVVRAVDSARRGGRLPSSL